MDVTGLRRISKPLTTGIIFSLLFLLAYVFIDRSWTNLHQIHTSALPTVQIILAGLLLSILAGFISADSANQLKKDIKRYLASGLACGLIMGILTLLLITSYIIIGTSFSNDPTTIGMYDYATENPDNMFSVLIGPLVIILSGVTVTCSAGSLITFMAGKIIAGRPDGKRMTFTAIAVILTAVTMIVVVPQIAIAITGDRNAEEIMPQGPAAIDFLSAEATFSQETKKLTGVDIWIKLNDTSGQDQVSISEMRVIYQPLLNPGSANESSVSIEHAFNATFDGPNDGDRVLQSGEKLKIHLGINPGEAMSDQDVLFISLKINDGTPIALVFAEPYLCPISVKYE